MASAPGPPPAPEPGNHPGQDAARPENLACAAPALAAPAPADAAPTQQPGGAPGAAAAPPPAPAPAQPLAHACESAANEQADPDAAVLLREDDVALDDCVALACWEKALHAICSRIRNLASLASPRLDRAAIDFAEETLPRIVRQLFFFTKVPYHLAEDVNNLFAATLELGTRMVQYDLPELQRTVLLLLGGAVLQPRFSSVSAATGSATRATDPVTSMYGELTVTSIATASHHPSGISTFYMTHGLPRLVSSSSDRIMYWPHEEPAVINIMCKHVGNVYRVRSRRALNTSARSRTVKVVGYCLAENVYECIELSDSQGLARSEASHSSDLQALFEEGETPLQPVPDVPHLLWLHSGMAVMELVEEADLSGDELSGSTSDIGMVVELLQSPTRRTQSSDATCDSAMQREESRYSDTESVPCLAEPASPTNSTSESNSPRSTTSPRRSKTPKGVDSPDSQNAAHRRSLECLCNNSIESDGVPALASPARGSNAQDFGDLDTNSGAGKSLEDRDGSYRHNNASDIGSPVHGDGSVEDHSFSSEVDDQVAEPESLHPRYMVVAFRDGVHLCTCMSMNEGPSSAQTRLQLEALNFHDGTVSYRVIPREESKPHTPSSGPLLGSQSRFVHYPPASVQPRPSRHLIENANAFGQLEGFSAMTKRIRDTEHPVPLCILMIFFRTMLATQWLMSHRDKKQWGKCAGEMAAMAIRRMEFLTDFELRNLQQDPRALYYLADSLSRLFVSADTISRGTAKLQVQKVAEQLILDSMVHFLRLSSIESRLFGLQNIIDAVKAYSKVGPGSINSVAGRSMQAPHRTPTFNFSAIGHEWLCTWLVSKDVIGKLYAGKNLHLELLRRSTAVVLFMSRENIITDANLGVIWEASIGRDFTSVRIMHNLLISLVGRLDHEARMRFFCNHICALRFREYDESGEMLRFIYEFTVSALQADKAEGIEMEDGKPLNMTSSSSSGTTSSISGVHALLTGSSSSPKQTRDNPGPTTQSRAGTSDSPRVHMPLSVDVSHAALAASSAPDPAGLGELPEDEAPLRMHSGASSQSTVSGGGSTALATSNAQWYGLSLLWEFVQDDLPRGTNSWGSPTAHNAVSPASTLASPSAGDHFVFGTALGDPSPKGLRATASGASVASVASAAPGGERPLSQRREAIQLLVRLVANGSCCESQRPAIIDSCINNIKAGSSVPQSLEILRRIINDLPQTKASWFSLSTDTRRTRKEQLIEKMDKQHKLVRLLCDDLKRYQSRVAEAFGLDIVEQDRESTGEVRPESANGQPQASLRANGAAIDKYRLHGSCYTHIDQLAARFDFLLFMLTNSFLYIKKLQAKELWATVVDNALSNRSRDVALSWFGRAQASGGRYTDSTGGAAEAAVKGADKAGKSSPDTKSNGASTSPGAKQAKVVDAESVGAASSAAKDHSTAPRPTSRRTVLGDDVPLALFRDEMRHLDLPHLSPTAFRVFQSFFLAINYRNKSIRRAGDSQPFLAGRRSRRNQEARALARAVVGSSEGVLFESVERNAVNVDGMDILWRVALESERNDVGFLAISLLVHLHVRLSVKLRGKRTRLQFDFIQHCVDKTEGAATKVRSAEPDSLEGLLRQARRASTALKLFLCHFSKTKLRKQINLVVIPPAIGIPGSLARRDWISIGAGISFAIQVFEDSKLEHVRDKIAAHIKVPPETISFRLVDNPTRVDKVQTARSGLGEWLGSSDYVSFFKQRAYADGAHSARWMASKSQRQAFTDSDLSKTLEELSMDDWDTIKVLDIRTEKPSKTSPSAAAGAKGPDASTQARQRQHQAEEVAKPIIAKALHEGGFDRSRDTVLLSSLPAAGPNTAETGALCSTELRYDQELDRTFNCLFNILDPPPGVAATSVVTMDAVATQQIWDSILLLPPDETVLHAVRELEEDWANLLPLRSIHRLLYAMRIIDATLERSAVDGLTSRSWFSRIGLLPVHPASNPDGAATGTPQHQLHSSSGPTLMSPPGHTSALSTGSANGGITPLGRKGRSSANSSSGLGPADLSQHGGAGSPSVAASVGSGSGIGGSGGGGNSGNSTSSSHNTASAAMWSTSSTWFKTFLQKGGLDHLVFILVNHLELVGGRRVACLCLLVKAISEFLIRDEYLRLRMSQFLPLEVAAAATGATKREPEAGQDQAANGGPLAFARQRDAAHSRSLSAPTRLSIVTQNLTLRRPSDADPSPALADGHGANVQDLEQESVANEAAAETTPSGGNGGEESGFRRFSSMLKHRARMLSTSVKRSLLDSAEGAKPIRKRQDTLLRSVQCSQIVTCVLEAMFDAFQTGAEPGRHRALVEHSMYLIMCCICIGGMETVDAIIRFPELRAWTEQLTIYSEDVETRRIASTCILAMCSLVSQCDDQDPDFAKRKAFPQVYLHLLMPVVHTLHVPVNSDASTGMLTRRAYRNLSSCCSEFYQLLCGLIDMVQVGSQAASTGDKKSGSAFFESMFDQATEALMMHDSLESFHSVRQDNLMIGLFSLIRTLVNKCPELKDRAIPRGVVTVLYHEFLFAPSSPWEMLERSSMDVSDLEFKAAFPGMGRTPSTRRPAERARGLLRRSFSGQSLILQDRSARCKTEASRDACLSLLLDLCEASPRNLDHLLRLIDEDGLAGSNKTDFLARFQTEWDYNPLTLAKHPSQFTGLKNQGATCYMNALLQQLYHIPTFAEAVLGMRGPPGTFLHQLQATFGSLRVSTRHYYDTMPLCQALPEADGKPVNLAEQKDANEFATQMFDRLESESADAKQVLDDHFGGTLVNQIISKDANNPYVSERAEPYHILPLDIRGHSNLCEALEAMVQSELLSGENQYRLESGETVDAIKRTCIRSAPNHLIINLKRFEFDLQTLTRYKLNDRFEFPLQLNLEPYTYDYLMRVTDTGPVRGKADAAAECDRPGAPRRKDAAGGREEDGEDDEEDDGDDETNANGSGDADRRRLEFEYELVGVIAHTGTMDSGHYFSFVRERRPRFPQVGGEWIEFNDKLVWPYPIDCLPSDCFGGVDKITRADGTSVKIPKQRSAYMLVYDRKVKTRMLRPEPRLSMLSDIPDLDGDGSESLDLDMDDRADIDDHMLGPLDETDSISVVPRRRSSTGESSILIGATPVDMRWPNDIGEELSARLLDTPHSSRTSPVEDVGHWAKFVHSLGIDEQGATLLHHFMFKRRSGHLDGLSARQLQPIAEDGEVEDVFDLEEHFDNKKSASMMTLPSHVVDAILRDNLTFIKHNYIFDPTTFMLAWNLQRLVLESCSHSRSTSAADAPVLERAIRVSMSFLVNVAAHAWAPFVEGIVDKWREQLSQVLRRSRDGSAWAVRQFADTNWINLVFVECPKPELRVAMCDMLVECMRQLAGLSQTAQDAALLDDFIARWISELDPLVSTVTTKPSYLLMLHGFATLAPRERGVMRTKLLLPRLVELYTAGSMVTASAPLSATRASHATAQLILELASAGLDAKAPPSPSSTSAEREARVGHNATRASVSSTAGADQQLSRNTPTSMHRKDSHSSQASHRSSTSHASRVSQASQGSHVSYASHSSSPSEASSAAFSEMETVHQLSSDVALLSRLVGSEPQVAEDLAARLCWGSLSVSRTVLGNCHTLIVRMTNQTVDKNVLHVLRVIQRVLLLDDDLDRRTEGAEGSDNIGDADAVADGDADDRAEDGESGVKHDAKPAEVEAGGKRVGRGKKGKSLHSGKQHELAVKRAELAVPRLLKHLKEVQSGSAARAEFFVYHCAHLLLRCAAASVAVRDSVQRHPQVKK